MFEFAFSQYENYIQLRNEFAGDVVFANAIAE